MNPRQSMYTIVIRQVTEHVHTMPAEHYHEAVAIAEELRQDYIANDLNEGMFDVVQVGAATPSDLMLRAEQARTVGA